MIQTISFEYNECTQRRKAMATWILEDDAIGRAAKAIEKIKKHKSLTIHNLDGGGNILATITLIGVELINIQYKLDYADSDACKYVLTISTNHKITRRFSTKNET